MGIVLVAAVLRSLILKVLASVADPHRKNANADADPGFMPLLNYGEPSNSI
jgi:hypothetical protein